MKIPGQLSVEINTLANTRVFQRLAAEDRIDAIEVGRNPPLRFLAKLFGLDDPASH